MKWLLALLVIVVALLHQDFWNWTNKTLVFGFVPIGLAYHAMYAVLASITMAVLVRYAWPKELEEVNTYEAPKVTEPSEAGA
jgi:hypothetical protein